MYVLISFNKQLKRFRQYFPCALPVNGRNNTISITDPEGEKTEKLIELSLKLKTMLWGFLPILISCKKSGDDGLCQLCINNRASKYVYIPFNSSSSFQQNIIQEDECPVQVK